MDSGIIGADGQFPAPTVHQNRQRNPAGPSEINQGVHCGPYRSAGIENVIHQDNYFIIQANRNFRFSNYGLVVNPGPIVSIEGNVQSPGRNRESFLSLEKLLDSISQKSPPGTDSD